MDDRRREVAKDLLGVASILGKAPPEHVGEITLDCECMATLFSCVSADSVNAKQVIAAQDHVMGRVRLARLQSVLRESPAGVEIMATVEDIARGSANDALADAGFKNALSCFSDGAMLRVRRSPEGEIDTDVVSLVIENQGLVVDSPMMITGLLREAMSQVLESAGLWSALQRGRQAEDMQRFAKHLAEAIGGVDLTLGFALFRAIIQPLQSISELHSEEDAAAITTLLRENASDWSMLMRSLSTSSTKDLVASCTNMRDKLQAPDDWDLKVLTGALTAAQHNERVRDALRVMVASVQKVIDSQIPCSASAMVDQWVARGADSFLCSSLALLSHAKELEELGQFDFGAVACSDDTDANGEPLMVRFSHTEHEPDEGPSIATIAYLPVAVAETELVVWCRARMTAAIGAMAENFIATLSMPGWKSPGNDVQFTKDMSLHDVASHFVDSNAMSSSVARMIAFLAAPTDPPAMPATNAFEQLAVMIDIAELEKIPWASPNTAPTDIVADRFMAWAELLSRMYQVACVFAWVRVTSMGGTCVMNGKVKPEMERAISELTENVEAGMLLLTSSKDFLTEAEPCFKQVYTPGVLGCTSWLKSAQDAAPVLAEIILQAVGANISEQAQRLKASLPTIDHYLNDTTYNTKLIKSKLVGYDRGPLTDQSVLLWTSLSDAGRLREKFDMCSASSEAFLEEPLGHGQMAFRSAKRFLAIVVGVEIVFKTTGSAKATEANKLLATKADLLPKTLVAELQKATTGVEEQRG